MSKFDIENFPTSETAKKMLRRVSPIYGNSYVGKWLYQVMGLEMDEAAAIVKSLRDQNFTQTVTWGIEYQEHKYSIEPDDSLSLEERRARLYRRKTEKYPLNPRRCELYFENGWGMTVDVDETYDYGILKLSLISRIPENVVEAIKDFRRIKPSHLSLKLESKREVDSTVYIGALPSLHRRYTVNPKSAADADITATIYANAKPSVHHRIVANPARPDNPSVSATIYVNAKPSAHHRIVASPRIKTMNEARATPRIGGKVGVHKRVTEGVMNNV
ncbi:MAG: DUF2313 domain-containing protein [Schwartzia sp.]|nr:DUF2313 domain-containing protein [Schwartzia sp. (in: firmicutes)]